MRYLIVLTLFLTGCTNLTDRLSYKSCQVGYLLALQDNGLLEPKSVPVSERVCKRMLED